jgi:hypothetical protein
MIDQQLIFLIAALDDSHINLRRSSYPLSSRMSGETMPKRVGRDPLVDSGTLPHGTASRLKAPRLT